MSFLVDQGGDIHGPTSHIPDLNPGLYVQGVATALATSNVKIKRPDGTWAIVLKVSQVHLRLPDGTWEVFT